MGDNTSHPSAGPLVGVWDLRVSPLNVGGALFFAAELKSQNPSFDFCLLSDSEEPGHLALLADDIQKSAPLAVLSGIEGVNDFYKTSSVSNLRKMANGRQIWPDPDGNGVTHHSYGSTLFLQEVFKRQGRIPRISCKPEISAWTKKFFQEQVHSIWPVAVHLKNDSKRPGRSNANMEAWLSFFKDCQASSEARFVLIGDEPVDERIERLPNVVCSRRYGGTIVKDMAVIEGAAAFMGMAAGPCAMAIIGEKPYAIFKNPGHHPEEMAEELGRLDRFSFAYPSQKLLRVMESREILQKEFAALSHFFDHGTSSAVVSTA